MTTVFSIGSYDAGCHTSREFPPFKRVHGSYLCCSEERVTFAR